MNQPQPAPASAQSAPPALDWFRHPALRPDLDSRAAAVAHQAQLTKPAGALGRLEALALRLAALQGRARPRVERVQITVFAADHGVAAAGVSAFPQAVTAQMLLNMARGGAAISVLARHLNAELDLVNLGLATPAPTHLSIRSTPIAPGSANLACGPALSMAQLQQALGAGHAAVLRALTAEADLFIGGEMGIGNSTAATALACALLEQPAAALTGPGTGLDAAGVARKQAVIEQALALHRNGLGDPLAALARLGGLEIAALAGAYITCARSGLPVLVDGFISSAAALAAVRLCPGAGDWLLLGHASAEPGHQAIIRALAAVGTETPLLDLDMRLGEGTGATMALPLLQMACALHNEMATFASAGVAAADAPPDA